MTIRGIAFPFGRSSTSFPATRTDDDVIADNIKRILRTARGSRVMRPGVGSDTHLFVFENVGPVLRARLDNEVRRALADGEPRVTVLFVTVQEVSQPQGGVEVLVTVDYEINRRPGSVVVGFSR